MVTSWLCQPKGLKDNLRKAIVSILPLQQPPGTEEVELILLEPASLSRACGAQGKRLPHLDGRHCPWEWLMAEVLRRWVTGEALTVGMVAPGGCGNRSCRDQGTEQLCEELLAPQGPHWPPPSSAHGAVLAQASSKPSNQALTLTLPACRGLNPSTFPDPHCL